MYGKEGKIYHQESIEKVDEATKKFPIIKELDDLCQSVDRSAEYKLINKIMGQSDDDLGTNRKITYIDYIFVSKAEWSEIKKSYLDYFTQRDWNRVQNQELGRELAFKKNDYKINITYIGDEYFTFSLGYIKSTINVEASQ